jgi:hypothetical protein
MSVEITTHSARDSSSNEAGSGSSSTRTYVMASKASRPLSATTATIGSPL